MSLQYSSTVLVVLFLQPEIQAKRELTEEERDQILLSSDFVNFMERATRTVERALAEPSGLFIDDLFGEGGSPTRFVLCTYAHHCRLY